MTFMDNAHKYFSIQLGGYIMNCCLFDGLSCLCGIYIRRDFLQGFGFRVGLIF